MKQRAVRFRKILPVQQLDSRLNRNEYPLTVTSAVVAALIITGHIALLFNMIGIL